MKTKTMMQLRNDIDVLDEKLIHLIAQRLSVGNRIGALKHKNNISIDDKQREQEVVKHISTTAKQKDVSPSFIRTLFAEIIRETKNKQRQVVKKPGGLRITIIGLGLIGGSLGLLIRRATNHQVIGFSKSASTRTTAVKIGAVHQASETIEGAVKNADVVIFATPVKQTLELLVQIAPHLKPNTIVTDTGSVKDVVCTQATKVLKHPELFIGGHPMAGTENSGIAAASENLFDNAIWIATLRVHSDKKAFEKLKKILTDLGFTVVTVDPKSHDMTVVLSSHLPSFVAVVLVQTLMQAEEKKISQMVSSGFRDTTRLALQSPDLPLEFAQFNKQELLAALASHRESIVHLEHLIKDERFDELVQLLKAAQRKRQSLFEQKNRFKPT